MADPSDAPEPGARGRPEDGSLRALLAELEGRGVRLELDGDVLVARARAGTGAVALDPALRERLRARRGDLVRHLRAQACPEAPLSFAQEGAWLLHRLRPRSPVGRLVLALELEGPLDVARLRAALAGLLARHAVLRSRYPEVDGLPRVVVEAAGEAPLEPQPARDADHARELLARAADEPFDLARGPLLRARLVRWAPERQALALIASHMVADGISMRLLWEELAARYAEDVPAAHALPYGELAARERARHAQGALDAHLEAWRRTLAGAPRLALPADLRPVDEGASPGGRLVFELPAADYARLVVLAREERCSPFVAGLALLQLLLARFTGTGDVCVGAPFANRDDPAARAAVGYLAQVCVLRTDVASAASFRELLRRARGAVLDALEHQEAPLHLVQRALAPGRDLAREPLFDVFLTFERDVPWPGLDGALARELDLPVARAAFALELALVEHERGARATLVYAADRFERSTVEGLRDALLALLGAAAGGPDRPLGELELLSPARRAAVLAWGVGAAPREPPRGLHEAFREVARRAPGALAVWSAAGAASFGELDLRAERLAAALRARGIGRGDVVALALERGIDLPAAMLGVLASGAAFLALDTTHPRERLRLLLEEAGPRCVVVHRAGAEAVPVEAARRLAWEDLPASPAAAAAPAPSPGEPAFLVQTSGSTGRPGLVVVPHAAAWNRCAWTRSALPFGADEVACQRGSPVFVDTLFEILVPLLAGVPHVVVPPQVQRDPLRFVRALAEARVTRLVLVPTVLASLLDSGELAGRRLPDLRIVVSSGEPLPPALAAGFRAACPHVRLLNLYGSAEIAADATWQEVGEPPAGALRVPVGRPIDGLRVFVCDGSGRPVPPGFPGEVCIGGLGLALGYRGLPARTAARFVPDGTGGAGGAGERLYRTGDRGRWRAGEDGGVLEVLGRDDDQLEVLGVRIEAGELELALAQHAAVREAFCAVVEPEGAVRLLVAQVELHPGARATPGELRAFLAARLPATHVPGRVLVRDALPRLPSGKLDRRRLRSEGAADPTAGEGSEPPATPTERVLAEAWGEVLGARRIARDASFFALGGHSLAIGRLQRLVAERLGAELLFHEVFEHPGLADLARVLEERVGRGRPGPQAAEEEGGDDAADVGALSFTQERFLLVHEIERRSAAYHLGFPLRLAGPLDVPALERALQEIVARHEGLRTGFSLVEGRGVARVREDVPVALARVDGRRWEDSAHALDELVARDVAQEFDVAAGPLFRFTLVRTGEAEHVLLSSFHHIACDKWSFGVLFEELAARYSAHVEGRPYEPPPLRSSPAIHARQVRRRYARERERLLEFWRSALRDLPRLELPTDRPRPQRRGIEGRRHDFVVPQEVAAGLRALAAEEDATLYMALCAAFAVLLARHAGQDDVVLGTPLAGRDLPGSEELIGPFADSLVLRFDLAGATSFREVLRRVRSTSLAAFAHGTMPFAALVAELGGPRDLARNPLFDVLFNLVPETDEPRMAGLEATFVDQEVRTSALDLSLVMADTRAGLLGTFEVDRALFEPRTVARLVAHLQTLLAEMVRAPDGSPFDVTLADGEERRLLARLERGVPALPAPRHRFDELFAQVARRLPRAPAVRWEGRTTTYAGLDAMADRIARQLLAAGVGPGDRVGLLVPRTPRLVAALVAIARCGAAWVPLDASHPDVRLSRVVRDAGAACLLAEGELRRRLGGSGRVLDLEALAGEARPAPPAPPAPIGPRRLDELAYLIHTSGSTGLPKGVAVEHGALSNLLSSMALRPGLGAGERLLAVTPLTFDIAALELLLPLVTGGCVQLAPDLAARDGHLLARLLAEGEADVLQATPSTWWLLLAAGWGGAPRLRAWCGGEELTRALADELLARCAELWNLYGPTETTIWSLAGRVRAGSGPVPLGRPVAGTLARVLDGRGCRVPVGSEGELHLGGRGLARGYWRDEERTRQRFVPDPLRPGERLFATGDRVRLDADGELCFRGRRDRQVKLRGVRLEPGEIEAVLQAVPGVRRCAVLVREDAPNDRRLVAYYVPDEGAHASPEALRAEARAALPPALVPSLYVRLAALPLTSSGKLDQRALLAIEPDPAAAPARTAPRDELEASIAEVWKRVLGVAEVDVDTSFFELGGHSLLLARARDELQALFPGASLVELFQHPTVAGLARHLAGQDARPAAGRGLAAGRALLQRRRRARGRGA